MYWCHIILLFRCYRLVLAAWWSALSHLCGCEITWGESSHSCVVLTLGLDCSGLITHTSLVDALSPFSSRLDVAACGRQEAPICNLHRGDRGETNIGKNDDAHVAHCPLCTKFTNPRDNMGSCSSHDIWQHAGDHHQLIMGAIMCWAQTFIFCR